MSIKCPHYIQTHFYISMYNAFMYSLFMSLFNLSNLQSRTQTCKHKHRVLLWPSATSFLGFIVLLTYSSSSSNSSLLLWNVPTAKFLPLFSSWRSPLYLSLAAFPVHMQYLLIPSIFPFSAYICLVPSWKSLYISL